MAATKKGVDLSFRRKWETEKYAEKAKERAERERADAEADAASLAASGSVAVRRERMALPIATRALEAREAEPDIDALVGKKEVVAVLPNGHDTAGYRCTTCDCVLKNSSAYYDHINGKRHQRALGMTMSIKQSSVQAVKERLQAKKRSRELAEAGSLVESYDLEARVKQALADEQAQADERAAKRKQPQAPQGSDAVPQPSEEELARQAVFAAMGLPTGFK